MTTHLEAVPPLTINVQEQAWPKGVPMTTATLVITVDGQQIEIPAKGEGSLYHRWLAWLAPELREHAYSLMVEGMDCGEAYGIVSKPPEPLSETKPEDDLDYTRIAPKRHTAMFPGLLGEIVEATTTRTEAVPIAVAINVICRLSVIFGRPSERQPSAPFLCVGDSIIHCRPFAIICGDTGKGRKGTSDKPVQRIFKAVERAIEPQPYLADPYHPLRLNTHTGGLSSGEGIAYCLRDAEPEKGNPEKDANRDMGASDKRLFIVEEEFANVITQCQRESNTLSAVIRCVFDGGTIAPLTKTSRIKATDPHVGIVSHITAHELIKKTTGNDIANGFLNRFMLLHTKRERIDPFPERTPDHVIDGFAKRVVEIVRFAHTAGEVTLAPESREVWQELYNDLTTWDHGHTINSLMARSEMYCLMLAMIFALMAKRNQITVPDLQAAYAWILYWKHTLIYIFDGERAKVEAEQQADFAETVFEAIASINGGNGCTQTEINNYFKGNRLTTEITPALEILLNTTPPRITVHTIKTGKRGRSPKVYAISQ